jgi:fused signal recognition particle receptor
LKGLWSALSKSRERIQDALASLLGFRGSIDSSVLERAEEALLAADLGWEFTEEVIAALQSASSSMTQDGTLQSSLRRAILSRLCQLPRWSESESEADVVDRPRVSLFVGVNGCGKTTTIAKLAHRSLESGASVLMACADTYRAAAAEQLGTWASRTGAEVLSQLPGSDPAAVAFDAIDRARSRGTDVLLVDTAGRLPNRGDLMAELSKIHRVCGKAMNGAPHDTILVLDGTVGQNALPQALSYRDALPVTGLIATKLDGTAKGGSVLAMANRLGLPIMYVGTGERLEDLSPFDLGEFVAGLVGDAGEGRADGGCS